MKNDGFYAHTIVLICYYRIFLQEEKYEKKEKIRKAGTKVPAKFHCTEPLIDLQVASVVNTTNWSDLWAP